MKRKVQWMAILLILLFGLCGCQPPSESGATATQKNQTTAGNEPTERPTEQPTAQLPQWNYKFDQEAGDLEYRYDYEDYYIPFWKRNIIKNECLCFVKNGEEITAKLMFQPEQILCVRDWSLKKEYKEGVDYVYDKEANVLRWIEGSSVPYFTQNWLSGKYEDGELMPAFTSYDAYPWSELGYARMGNAIYCIGEPLYSKQMHITYTYSQEDFQGSVNSYQGDKLPNVMKKLMNGEALKVVFYGDSVPYGCDVSSMYNREPQQPPYPKIFCQALEDIYGSKVGYRNTAVGGTTSQWGVENLEKSVIRHKPDLAVILFGGNDDPIGAAAATAKNMEKMVQQIQAELPQTDIIIMGTFVGNEAGGFNTPNLKPLLTGYFNDIASRYERVAAVDMYNLHSYLLQNKNYIDFSGNGINHPNDFLIRIHAQQLLSTVVDFDAIKANQQ